MQDCIHRAFAHGHGNVSNVVFTESGALSKLLGFLLGVFVMQWGIGLAVDGFRAAGLAEAPAFRAALAVFAACSLLAYGYFVFASRDNRTE